MGVGVSIEAPHASSMSMASTTLSPASTVDIKNVAYMTLIYLLKTLQWCHNDEVGHVYIVVN